MAPKRLSEAKRSSSSKDGSTLALLLSLLESFFPAFVVTGSASTEGLGTAVGGGAREREAAGKAAAAVESGGAGLASTRLFFSGKGETTPNRLEVDPGTPLSSASSSSTTDLWADFCLAARDWGLRCAETLARVCMTQDLHTYHIRNPSYGEASRKTFGQKSPNKTLTLWAL